MFSQRQSGADQHAGWMTDVNESVPIVEIERVREQAVGEGRGGNRCLGAGAPDRGFGGNAETLAVIEGDFRRLRRNAGERNAEHVQDMQLGVGAGLGRRCWKIRFR